MRAQLTTDRKKPGWAFWTTVALSLPVLYVLSFGPACWWFSQIGSFPSTSRRLRLAAAPRQYVDLPHVYWPLGWAANRGEWPKAMLTWYGGLGLPRGTIIFVGLARLGD